MLQVPSVDDLTSGRARIDALRPIAIEDLLGRDEVHPDTQLLGPGIRDAVVCVTGAGGSIGSELCRQILALSPTRLILLERRNWRSMPSSRSSFLRAGWRGAAASAGVCDRPAVAAPLVL